MTCAEKNITPRKSADDFQNKKKGIQLYPLGWRVVLSGGNSNNGDQAGFAALNANNSSGNRNSNIGSHACNLSPCCMPLPLGKTQNRSHKVLVVVNMTAKVLGLLQGYVV